MPELLYELLPRLRKERGMSQNDLSHRTAREGVGVSVATIQSYEKASGMGTMPKAHILEAIAAALDVPPDVFYEWPIARTQAMRGTPSSQPDTQPVKEPSPQARAIARELAYARGVPLAEDGTHKGRGTISRDKLALAAGVLPATLRWIEEARSDNPDDAFLAALYDQLPDANPTDTPHLALARARWALDPRNQGVDAASARLAEVADVLLPVRDAEEQFVAALEGEADRQDAKRHAKRVAGRAESRRAGRQR